MKSNLPAMPKAGKPAGRDSAELMNKRNHDVTAQRLTSAHPLSFLFWRDGGITMLHEIITSLNQYITNPCIIISHHSYPSVEWLFWL